MGDINKFDMDMPLSEHFGGLNRAEVPETPILEEDGEQSVFGGNEDERKSGFERFCGSELDVSDVYWFKGWDELDDKDRKDKLTRWRKQESTLGIGPYSNWQRKAV